MRGEVWAYMISLSQKAEGTNFFHTGHYLRILTLGALLISFSKTQFRAPMKLDSGRMHSSVVS